MTAFPHKFSGT